MKINQILVCFLVVFNGFIVSATNIDFIPAPPPPPTNDECTNAIPLTVGTACSMTQYTNASATASAGIPAPGCASYSGGDVWFSAVVPANGRLIIDSQTGVITDGGMAIYSGTCGALTLIDCSDDDSDNGLMPKIDASGLTPGATIYIRMWEYGNDNNGTFSICAYTIESSDAASCGSADPFCTGTGILFPASFDMPDAETGPNYGCLCSQPNPVWYYLRIANPGSLTINISSTCGDVDYAAWGPFSVLTCSSSDLTSTGASCTTTPYSAPAGNMVDCSFSTAATESLSIPSALTGQYYMVMITNYANCEGTINFNQTSGAGSTDCSIIAPPVTNNGPLCAGQTLNLTVTSPVAGATYAWTGPNGFTSSTMEPSITNVTTANAGVYSLIITLGGTSSAPVTTTVVVNSAPSPTIGSNSPICAGSALNLTSSGGTSYSWSGPNGFTSATQNPSIASSTTLASGTYTVTVTATGGCTATAQISVVVNAMPIPTISNGGPICTGSTLNLTSSGGISYSWSGPNGFTSAIQNPSITTATTTVSGVYTVTVTATGGCTATAQTTAVVNNQPTATIGSNSPICEGSALNLTSSGGTSYSWSGPNGFTSATQNPSIASSTTLASGTYTVTVTATGGCTATAQISVVVNAMPIPTISNGGPICTGSTLNLTSSGGISYSWSGPNGFTSAIQNPSITTATTTASGVYTVTVTATGGCTATAQTTAVVNNQPTATIGSNSPICEGSALNLTSSGGITYSWSGPNGFTSTLQNPSIASSTALASGVYTVTVTATGGCTISIQTTTNVNALPIPTASNNGPLCAGTLLNLTSSGGITYNWSGPNGYTSTLQNPTISSITSAGSGIYTVTVTATGGCTATAQTTVVINSNVSAVPSSNSPICQNQTLNLTVPVVGSTYSWSGPNGFSSAIQSPAILNSTTLASGIYSVTVTSAAGCSGTGSVSVVVNPLPVVQITGDSVICNGQNTVLTVSGGISYNWSNMLTFASITVTPTAQTTYTVTVTGTGGCTSTGSRTVFLNPNPQIDNISVTNDNCNSGVGEATAIVSSGTSPYTFIWSNGNGNTATNSLLIAGVYSVTVSDANGCVDSETFSVINNPGPELSVTNIFNDHCNKGIGQATVIVNNIPGNYTYTWLTTPPQSGITASGLLAGTYIAQVTDGVCSSTLAVTISNLPGPTAEFTASPLSANTTNATIHFINQSEGAEAYSWDFGDGENSMQIDPVHQYTSSNTYHVVLEVTDAFGCIDTAAKDILIYDDYNLFIPNTFTPNGDGLNDVFKPYGKGVNLKMGYNMQIFDRWGKKVYYTHRFENGWDGKIDGVRLKSNGVFTYVISVYDNANQQHLYKGTFTVMGSKDDSDF